VLRRARRVRLDAEVDRVRGTGVTGVSVEFKGRTSSFRSPLVKSSTTIDATVTDANGQPAHEAVLLVFSTNREKWLPQSRFVRLVYPNPEGHMIVNNLPPGDYYAAAVEVMEQGFERNPEVLDKLSRGAERITLIDGRRNFWRYSP
jgi:hypothetical protein